MKFSVTVTLKKDVLDPQGKVVHNTLVDMGMSNLKSINNLKMTVIGLVLIIIVYYIKDFSLALGQIGKVSLILSIWAPIIALSLFTFIGVIQINEK